MRFPLKATRSARAEASIERPAAQGLPAEPTDPRARSSRPGARSSTCHAGTARWPLRLLLLGTMVGAPVDAFARVQDQAPCFEPGELQVKVDSTTDDPATRRQVVDQLMSELSPTREGPCPNGEDTGPTRVGVQLRATSAHVTVETAREGSGLRRERDVDLAKIDPEGAPLAIAIAADELLRDLREQLKHPAKPPPEPTLKVIRIESTELTTSAPPPPFRLRGFGPTMAIESFMKGVTMAGVDARLALDLLPHVALLLRAGIRAPFATSGAPAPFMAGLAGGHVLLVPTRERTPVGVGALLGADALGLRGASRSDFSTTVLLSGGLAFWSSLAHGLFLMAELTVGDATEAVHPRAPDGPRRDVSGVVVGASVGIFAGF